MGAFVNLVYEYANYIILAGMLLQMIIILQVLVKVNRTDRRLQMIQGKVEDYLNVILTEDSGKEEPLVSRQEELMRDSIEKKRKQQEEAVFNAVLKEIFSLINAYRFDKINSNEILFIIRELCIEKTKE